MSIASLSVRPTLNGLQALHVTRTHGRSPLPLSWLPVYREKAQIRQDFRPPGLPAPCLCGRWMALSRLPRLSD